MSHLDLLTRGIKRLVVLCAIGGGCFHPPPVQRSRPATADQAVKRFAENVRRGDFSGLTSLLTQHCLRGCRGFKPVVVSVASTKQVARWIPRLGGQSPWIVDFAAAIASYKKLDRFELDPIRIFDMGGLVQMRLRLKASGVDREGLQREDEGIIDATLRRRDGVFRFSALSIGQVQTTRRVPESSDNNVDAEPDEPDEEPQEPDIDEPDSSSSAPAGVAIEQLLDPAQQRRWKQIATQNVGVVLLSSSNNGSSQKQWCLTVQQWLEKRSDVYRAVLGVRPIAGCQMPFVKVTPTNLGWISPVLPAVAIVRGGRVVRVDVSLPDRAQLEADIGSR